MSTSSAHSICSHCGHLIEQTKKDFPGFGEHIVRLGKDREVPSFYKPTFLEFEGYSRKGRPVGDAFDHTDYRMRDDLYFVRKGWQLEILVDSLYSRQGVLFIFGLRKQYPDLVGRDAAFSYDHRCFFCFETWKFYKPPPDYDANIPCHDVFQALFAYSKLDDVIALRRKSDGKVVFRQDWCWDTLSGEKEVTAMYQRPVLENCASHLWWTLRGNLQYILHFPCAKLEYLG